MARLVITWFQACTACLLRQHMYPTLGVTVLSSTYILERFIYMSKYSSPGCEQCEP